MGQYNANGFDTKRPAAQRQASHDRAALELMDWDNVPRKFGDCVAQFGIWRIWTTDSIAEATVYTQPDLGVIVLNPKTWRTLHFKPEITEVFFQNFLKPGASGMKFLCMDSGPYGEAARLEARRDAERSGVDVLTNLNRAAEGLILQASSLAGQATPGQVKMFFERLADLQRDLEEAQERLNRVRALIDVAGDSVMAACP